MTDDENRNLSPEEIEELIESKVEKRVQEELEKKDRGRKTDTTQKTDLSRRSFMKMAGLGAGGLALSSLGSASFLKLGTGGGGSSTPNLSSVLSEGNSAGSYNIDLAGNNLKDSQGTLTVDSKTEFTGDIQDNNANIVYSQTDSEIPSGRLAQVDSSISYIEEGQDSNKPSAGTSGRYYYATDTQILYRDNGTSWTAIGGVGTSSNKLPNQHVQSLSAADLDIDLETPSKGDEVIWSELVNTPDNTTGLEDKYSLKSVSTSAVTLIDLQSRTTALAVISGIRDGGTERFNDIVGWGRAAESATVIMSNGTGSAASRSYSTSQDDASLQLSMGSNTYNVATRTFEGGGAFG